LPLLDAAGAADLLISAVQPDQPELIEAQGALPLDEPAAADTSSTAGDTAVVVDISETAPSPPALSDPEAPPPADPLESHA